MFSRTRPSSQSYHVAAVCGEPSGRSVAITAAFGCARNSSTSSGTGTLGTRGSLRGCALLGPALEPRVRLPERHCAVVLLAALVRHGCFELLERRTARDDRGPLVETG